MTSTTATGNLGSITKYSDVVNQSKTNGINNAMDQKAFLTLFTTQLKNQNPLDPMKNENFVAQLAQFSQLEATTNMATTLKDYVNSASGERILGSASLIGKKVAVPGASAVLSAGQKVNASIQLDEGAEGMTVEVLDSKGSVVRTAIYGAQSAGSVALTWDGLDNNGQALPDGNYTLRAKAVVQGKTTNPEVAVYAAVQSVVQTGNDLQLQVAGGKSISLSSVQRITN
jgi:flagellar basal-body rod modification protein FlgD